MGVLFFLGVSHEMGNLKMQVQEAIATKSITEDMNMALQVKLENNSPYVSNNTFD